jgi:HJR/Mrr/RecB family endonuclease
MELGETKDAIIAQHGKATEENHSKNTATYRQGQWKVDLQYQDDVACKITFSRIGQLSEAEIQSILTQNAAGMEWQEQAGTTAKRTWQRSDLAIADCNRAHPALITFRQAPPGAEQPEQHALVEEESSPALAESSPTVYGLEPNRETAPQITSPAFTASAINFVQRFPLVFAIPAILLLVVLLIGRKKKAPAPSTPARRVVTPRPINDAMAVGKSLMPGDLEASDFDLLVGELFRRKGYEVEISGGIGSDGGSDLWLRKDGQLTLVQCRQWGNWKVSAPPMQEFLQTVAEPNGARGIFVTTGDYTDEARELAQESPVELIDGAGLNRLIAEVAKPGEDLCDLGTWLDGFASNVKVSTPACPFCQEAMSLKRGLQGKAFWSCQTFPRCAGKRDGRVELLQRLPGLAAS